MSRWFWCLLAALFIVSRDFGTAGLFDSLGDTDDATRLIQVREWLAGAGWHDLLLPRFGGPTPLLSHWSRLIDVPIAALLLLFGMVLSPEGAELATRIVWPTLLLMLLLRMLVAEAERRAGAIASLIALALAVTTVAGLYQFRVGRLDHHNAMILLTVGGLLMLARSVEAPRVALGAGALLGLALTIGYEPLLLIAPVLAITGLAATVSDAWLRPARNVTTALAATLGIGLATSTPPALWHLPSPCDAIGLNLVAFAACGAIGLAMVTARGAAWTAWQRMAVLAIAIAIGAALYVHSNPICLGGPFALVNADARAYWLDTVLETKSAVEMLAFQPVPALVYLVTAAAGIGAAVINYRRAQVKTEWGKTEWAMTSAAMVILTAVVLPLAATQTKFMAYGSFIAVVPLAIAIAAIDPGSRLTPLAARLLGVIVISQASLTGLATGALSFAGQSNATAGIDAVRLDGACLTTDTIKPLGVLPRGLVVAPADLGPFIVALTHHDVLAAPYHRIDRAIADSYRLFDMPLEAAERMLGHLHADYLVDCMPVHGPKAAAGSGLRARLARGETIPFLTALASTTHRSAVRAWRVERTSR